jgi:hypothetical protein
MSVIVVRLVNGEELMGQLGDETDTTIQLSKVAVIQMMPSQSGLNVGLFPFAPYSEDEKFTFKKEHVVTTFTAGLEILNNYNQIYGSGIQIAGSKVQSILKP